MRRVDLVAAFFKARPHQWIDGMEIREFAGGYGGWSARIRDARREYGMQIENRVRVFEGGRKVSEYRFVPTEEKTGVFPYEESSACAKISGAKPAFAPQESPLTTSLG